MTDGRGPALTSHVLLHVLWLSGHLAVASFFLALMFPKEEAARRHHVHRLNSLKLPFGHLAPRWPSQLVAVWLTLDAATCAGFRPAALCAEMEHALIVFDAVYDPGGRGWEGEKLELVLQSGLFQLSTEVGRRPGRTRHESLCWQRPTCLNTRALWNST